MGELLHSTPTERIRTLDRVVSRRSVVRVSKHPARRRVAAWGVFGLLLLLAGLLPAEAGRAAESAHPAPALCASHGTSPPAARIEIPDDATPEALLAQADRAFARGALDQAGALWSEAARRFATADRVAEQVDAIARAAQTRAAQGYLGESRTLLEEALERLGGGDPARSASLLAALARSQQDGGDAKLAASTSELALAAARASGAPRAKAVAESARGDVLLAQGEAAAALEAYAAANASALAADDALLSAQTGSLAARAAQAAGRGAEAKSLLAAARTRADALPPSDAKAQLLLHLGAGYERLAAGEAGAAARLGAAAAYAAAEEAAASAGAQRSLAFALGYRAALYEQEVRYDEALQLTRRALRAADAADAPEALYRFESQSGRILRARGDAAGARDAYRRALRTLERSSDPGQGLGFERAVEPVYLGLVDLLLQEARASADAGRRRALLSEARNRVEDLKSKELTDHYHDPCLTGQRKALAESVGTSIVVYPIVLPDRTELILARGDELTSLVVPVASDVLDARVLQFRRALQKRTRRDYLVHAAELYDWLIRPLRPELQQGPIDALVFVPGGSLRTIPMAALYDREAKQFLIEQVPVAIIPALTLTDPRAIEQRNVRTLLAGLTLSVRGYPALENVGTELAAVGEILGGESLVDQQFVTSAMEDALTNESYNVVHIASHGEFLADAADSFLVTYDGQIGLDRLSLLVERRRFGGQPIELLTLSACETAAGDDRAALGLAGVAIRAGARSAIATLWTVNDQAASVLIGEFYRQLAVEGSTRAEALRRAQVSLLRSRPYRHPGYWSPFVLISNWL